MEFLQDLNVLVLGLGESGLAMARWCVRCGARVHVWDSREAPPHAETLKRELQQATLFNDALDAGALAGVQLVLKSPGLAPHDERIRVLIDAARSGGVAVLGELDLFARALSDLREERGYAPKVIAITGTNGKTTTTALTALLVERCGRRVASAGNIGPTMLDTLAAALAQEGEVDARRTPPPQPSPVKGTAEAVPSGVVGPPPSQPSPIKGEGANAPADVVDAARVPPSPLTGEGGDGGGDVPPPSEDAEPESVPDDNTPLVLTPPPASAPSFEHLPEVWVLELSSFQLDRVQGFEPSAAAVLNLTQDHLDWHGSMDAYAKAKARVFGDRTVMVINRDDALVEAMVPAPVLVKGTKGRAASAASRNASRTVLRFGVGAPQAPGDFGLVDEGGMTWLVRALQGESTPIKRPRAGTVAAAATEVEPLHLQRLMPADALRLRGRHNAANALAALALATAIGCPLAPMLHGLREYRGEPHRVEFIGSVDGVEAFDDSKGTNVGATVAALNGLGADKSPAKLVLVLGGDGKGQDFAPLADGVRRHARAVALIGRDAAMIEQALAATGVTMQRHASLEDATRWCFAQAQAGDAVLLSPACASLDMFRNYGHRAEVFVSTVRELAAERGMAIL